MRERRRYFATARIWSTTATADSPRQLTWTVTGRWISDSDFSAALRSQRTTDAKLWQGLSHTLLT